MSTQDPITEMLNAIERNPELAEVLRAHILGDDFMATTEQVLNEQQAVTDLLGRSVELSGAMVNVITAVQARQSSSDDAIAGLQQGQESMRSAIAEMRTDIRSMAANQSRMEEAIGHLKSDVAELKSDVAELKSDVAELKSDVAELKSDVAELKSDVATLKSDVAALKSDVAELKSDVSILKTDMVYVKGRLDNAVGANYEFKVQKNLGSIAGQNLRLRRTRTLKGPRTDDDQDLRNRVDEAEDNGIITESENHDMWLLDLIFSGRRRDDGKEVLVAAEISITAGNDDVSRAKERSETLRKATDIETIPVVIAEHIDQERYEAAEQVGVVVITVSES